MRNFFLVNLVILLTFSKFLSDPDDFGGPSNGTSLAVSPPGPPAPAAVHEEKACESE
jgi:hypothetical protein